MLWAYWIMPRNSTKETPYFLAFGSKAIILVEIGLRSHQTTHFPLEYSNDNLRAELDLSEGRRDMANLRAAAYKQCFVYYYNSCVKQRVFKI